MKNIEKFINVFRSSNNLDVDKSIEVFANHMNEVAKRSNDNGYIDQEVEKVMLDEIGTDNFELAKKFFEEFSKEFDLKATTNFEVFLISTHLSLLKKG